MFNQLYDIDRFARRPLSGPFFSYLEYKDNMSTWSQHIGKFHFWLNFLVVLLPVGSNSSYERWPDNLKICRPKFRREIAFR